MEKYEAFGTIGMIGCLILTIPYSILIYKFLHSRFNYVFWGNGFSKHIMAVAIGGFILSALTLCAWIIVDIIIAITGIVYAVRQETQEAKIGVIVFTVILAGIVAFFGCAFLSTQLYK